MSPKMTKARKHASCRLRQRPTTAAPQHPLGDDVTVPVKDYLWQLSLSCIGIAAAIVRMGRRADDAAGLRVAVKGFGSGLGKGGTAEMTQLCVLSERTWL